MYSPDLIKSAASWASRPPSGVTHVPNAFAQSRDWERVAPPTLKLAPRYADSYKKRMDLPPNLHPHTGIVSSNASISSTTTVSTLGDSPSDYFGVGKPAISGEERFGSLTELKWGEFEALGFGGLESGEKKLQFDLTEGARTVYHVSTFCCAILVYLPRHVAVPGGKTDNVDLDRFLIYWFLAHGCPT